MARACETERESERDFKTCKATLLTELTLSPSSAALHLFLCAESVSALTLLSPGLITKPNVKPPDASASYCPAFSFYFKGTGVPSLHTIYTNLINYYLELNMFHLTGDDY